MKCTLIELLAGQGAAQRAKRVIRFTLIELLVAIAVIAILAALLLPVLSRAKYSANLAVCTSNQRQVVMMALMYADDNDGRYAPAVAYDTAVDNWSIPYWIVYHMDTAGGRALIHYMGEYIQDPEIFFCPLVPGRPEDTRNRFLDADVRFLKGSYALLWNHRKYDGINDWQAPRRVTDGTKLLTADMLYWVAFGYDEMRFNHHNFNPDVQANSNDWESFWIIPGPSTMAVPATTLNAGYADGHVESFPSDKTVTLSTDASSWIVIPDRFD